MYFWNKCPNPTSIRIGEQRKMKKRTLTIVSGIFAIGTPMLTFLCYHEFYVEPFYHTHLPTMNPQPFFETAYGISALAIWIFIGLLWLILLAKLWLADTKKTIKTGVTMFLVLVSAGWRCSVESYAKIMEVLERTYLSKLRDECRELCIRFLFRFYEMCF